MSVKLLTEHHLEFLSLKEVAQAHLSLHLLKCHIVGNHMPWLKFCNNHNTYLTAYVQSLHVYESFRVPQKLFRGILLMQW